MTTPIFQSSESNHTDHELIESLISLAAMLDSQMASEQEAEEAQTSSARKMAAKIEGAFSFYCGWDRLMARFRERSVNRVFLV